jgi:hypothetical protein
MSSLFEEIYHNLEPQYGKDIAGIYTAAVEEMKERGYG